MRASYIYLNGNMGIAKLHGADDHARFIAHPGYAIIVYMHAGDCPSDQFVARCFEWAREYPFIRFAMIDTAEGCAGLEPVAFVPMATFYRSGKRVGSPLVGTDFARMESILQSMRVDGGALVTPAPCVGATGIYIAPHVDRAIFARRKK